MLALQRNVNQTVVIHVAGQRIEIMVVRINVTRDGCSVRLGIDAPKDVPIVRGELENEWRGKK